MRSLVVALLLVSIAAPAAAQAPVSAARRLHCPVIASADIATHGRVSSTQALQALEDERLWDQEAELLHVRVSSTDVEGALAGVARQNELDRAGLEAAIVEQGYDLASYRRNVASQIRRLRVLSLLLPDHSFGSGADPGAWLLAQMRSRTAAVRTPADRGLCHESWPAYDVSQVHLVGLAPQDTATLRAAITPLGSISVGPAGELPPDATQALVDVYARRGQHVRVEPTREDAAGLWVTLTLAGS